jgi:hypothetical protein
MENQTYTNCQSCGIPLSKDPHRGGTEADGSKSGKYCGRCYENGTFKGGNVSLREFSEWSRKGMIESGNNRFFAWFFSRPFLLKHLDRWKNKG